MWAQYSHEQELFYKFVSKITNRLVKQLLSMTVCTRKTCMLFYGFFNVWIFFQCMYFLKALLHSKTIKQYIYITNYIFQASLAYILFISFYVFDYRIQMGLNTLWHFLPTGTISSHVQLGPSTTIKMASMRTQKLTICETITLFL